jgi:glycyl-tRNA synthetase alpha chain
VISVAERQAYIGRVRDLAKGGCAAWMAHKGYEA